MQKYWSKCVIKNEVSDIYIKVLLIVFVGIVSRILTIILFDFSDFKVGDSAYYMEVGENIIKYGIHGSGEQNIVPTYFRPPIYSWFVGMINWIFIKKMYFFFIIQSLISILSAVLVFLLIRGYNSFYAIIIGIFLSISPFEALLNSRILGENLASPLILCATVILIFYGRRHLSVLIAGTMMGLAILVRDVYLLLPVFTVFFLYLFCKYKSINYFLYILAVALILSPWYARNYQLSEGDFFLSKGIFWQSLWFGSWEESGNWTKLSEQKIIIRNKGDSYKGGLALPNYAYPVGASKEKKEEKEKHWNKRDQKYLKNLFLEKLTNHPFDVVKTWIKKSPSLWTGTRTELFIMDLKRFSLPWYIAKSIYYLINTTILIFAVFGIILSFRNDRLIFLLSAPIIYNILIYIPHGSSESRYSLAVYQVVIIFFAYFVATLLKKARNFRRNY